MEWQEQFLAGFPAGRATAQGPGSKSNERLNVEAVVFVPAATAPPRPALPKLGKVGAPGVERGRPGRVVLQEPWGEKAILLGHDLCQPLPVRASHGQGRGPCCRGQSWDVFPRHPDQELRKVPGIRKDRGHVRGLSQKHLRCRRRRRLRGYCEGSLPCSRRRRRRRDHRRGGVSRHCAGRTQSKLLWRGSGNADALRDTILRNSSKRAAVHWQRSLPPGQLGHPGGQ
mmetsp:Transcript_52398/g.170058  ORF Transcript_52398/g.170058 Transcript_52398/m.170058 type:complete len:227 (+) Transcript_52398:2106-2786(+)